MIMKTKEIKRAKLILDIDTRVKQMDPYEVSECMDSIDPDGNGTYHNYTIGKLINLRAMLYDRELQSITQMRKVIGDVLKNTEYTIRYTDKYEFEVMHDDNDRLPKWAVRFIEQRTKSELTEHICTYDMEYHPDVDLPQVEVTRYFYTIKIIK